METINNIKLEITKKSDNTSTSKYVYCSNLNCGNSIKQDFKLAIINKYYYLFCSEECWHKWINSNNTKCFTAQFKNYEDYYKFNEKIKKKDRNYCYYSRSSYCGF